MWVHNPEVTIETRKAEGTIARWGGRARWELQGTNNLVREMRKGTGALVQDRGCKYRRREDNVTVRGSETVIRSHTIIYTLKTVIQLSLCINIHSLNNFFSSALLVLFPRAEDPNHRREALSVEFLGILKKSHIITGYHYGLWWLPRDWKEDPIAEDTCTSETEPKGLWARSDMNAFSKVTIFTDGFCLFCLESQNIYKLTGWHYNLLFKCYVCVHACFLCELCVHLHMKAWADVK